MRRSTHVSDVPDDYPYIDATDSLPESQPQCPMVECEGKFYPAGNTPFERWLEWTYSELLVEHFVEQRPVIKSGNGAHMLEEDIIAQCCARAVAAGSHYGTEAQLQWVFRQVASLLGWPIPDVCKQHS